LDRFLLFGGKKVIKTRTEEGKEPESTKTPLRDPKSPVGETPDTQEEGFGFETPEFISQAKKTIVSKAQKELFPKQPSNMEAKMDKLLSEFNVLKTKVTKEKPKPAVQEDQLLKEIEELMTTNPAEAKRKIKERRDLLALAISYGWGPVFKVAKAEGIEPEKLPEKSRAEKRIDIALSIAASNKVAKKKRFKKWKKGGKKFGKDSKD